MVFGGFRVFLRFLCFGHLLRHPFRSRLQLERSICAAPDAVRVNHHAWCPSGAVDELQPRFNAAAFVGSPSRAGHVLRQFFWRGEHRGNRASFTDGFPNLVAGGRVPARMAARRR